MNRASARAVFLAAIMAGSCPALPADSVSISGDPVTISFQVSGSSNIHQVILDIDTNEIGNSLGLWSYSIGHSAAANTPGVNYNADLSRTTTDLSDNGDADVAGSVNIDLHETVDSGDGTQVLRLKLTANPNTAFSKGSFTSTYNWRFIIDAAGASSHTYTIVSSALDAAIPTSAVVAFPEINVRDTLGNLPDGSGSHDFGSVAADGDGGTFLTETFTVDNTGGANLGISVTLDDSTHFDLDTTLMNPTVTPPNSAEFTISFDPTSTGPRTATVTVRNNDVFEYDYTFTVTGNGTPLVPEINVRDALGDLPNVTGSHAFTDVAADGDAGAFSSWDTITIENTGSATLNLAAAPYKESGDTADFDIDTAATDLSVEADATPSTTFRVRFDPLTSGAKSAVVRIDNGDSDENPYRFTVTGTGTVTAAPEINVRDTLVDLPNTTGSHTFTDVAADGDAGASSSWDTITIENTGSATLNLAAAPYKESGDTADFDIDTAATDLSVEADATPSTTFRVRFDPLTSGAKSAVVRIDNGDSDENPYRFTVAGNALPTAPEIDITDGAGAIPDSTGFHFFGSVPADGEGVVVGSPETFTIANTGNAPLIISGISLSAGNTADFDLVAAPVPTPAAPWTIAVGGAPRTFTVRFDPLAPGTRGATVTVASNDNDENPYTFAVTGDATPMDTILFPPTRGLPWESGPFIDGVVDRNPFGPAELGWNNAFRLTYENGTYPRMAFQALRDPSTSFPNLFMSFEVKGDATFDDEDLIVLCFRPNQDILASPANDLRIFIKPVKGGSGAHDPAVDPVGGNPLVAKPNRPAQSVTFYRKQDGGGGNWQWQDVTARLDASGFDIKVYSYPEDPANPATTTFAWNVEMKMPRTVKLDGADWITLQQDFKFFFDVVKVDSTLPTKYAVQYTWPRNLPENPRGELAAEYGFPFVFWGNSSINNTGQVKGVSVDRSGIGVLNHPTQSAGIQPSDLTTDFTIGTFNPGGDLTARALNRVTVTVRNSSEKVSLNGSTGVVEPHPVPAESVRVRIRIAHWGATLGTGADWRVLEGLHETDVASPAFPPAPSGTFQWRTYADADGWLQGADIPAGTVTAPGLGYFFYDYVLPDADVDYFRNTQDHQCIYVEVDSLKDTDIITRSTWQNMNFVSASTYKDVARISARGIPDRPAAAGTYRVLLATSKKSWAIRKDEKERRLAALGPTTIAAVGAGSGASQTEAVDSYLEYTVDAYYESGTSVVINGKTISLLKPIGSFGYVAHHDGPVTRWETDLKDAEKVAEGLYELRIKPNGFADIKPTIISHAPDTLVGISGGVALPLLSTASSSALGPAASLTFGRQVLPNLWLLGILGYAGLLGTGGAADAHWISASVDAGYRTAVRPPFVLDARVGAGCYYRLGTGGAAGVNAGLAAEYAISSSLSAEVGADYHHVFDAGGTDFLTVTAGLFLRF